jgi:hypothetical protein
MKTNAFDNTETFSPMRRQRPTAPQSVAYARRQARQAQGVQRRERRATLAGLHRVGRSA